MKAQVERINSVQCRLIVEVAPAEVDAAFAKAYSKIQKQAKIQGFRPGKAPLQMIKKLYGASVENDVGYELINQNVFAAIRSENLRAVAQPVVDELPQPVLGQTFKFSAVVDVMPDITVGQIRGLSVAVEQAIVAEVDVEREFDMLRRRAAKLEPVAGDTVEAGNFIKLSHTATVAGEPYAGFTVNRLPVELGVGQLLPGLEEALIGMKTGENKSVSVDLPADYGVPDIAGKTAVFSLGVDEIHRVLLPSLDDEFAKDFGAASLSELRTRLRDQLTSKLNGARRRKLERALLEQMLKQHTFEVPPAIVDAFTDDMIGRLPVSSKKERERALQDESLRKELREPARRQAQEMLLLGQVARNEKIEITDDELRHEVCKLTEQHQHGHDHDHDHDHGHDHSGHDHSAVDVNSDVGRRVREQMTLTRAMELIIGSAIVTDLPAKT